MSIKEEQHAPVEGCSEDMKSLIDRLLTKEPRFLAFAVSFPNILRIGNKCRQCVV